MHFTSLSLPALCTVFISLASAQLVEKRAALPDALNVPGKNLYPEDGVFDLTRGLLYQSNLWKGELSVWNPSDNSKFTITIDGVSSSGTGPQQMAGVSLDTRVNAKRLYAVAKPSDAFRFDGTVHNQGPCSFHAFDLPVSATSKPVWSVDMKPVQAAFQKQYGIRPYGNVASAQDSQGNSYVIFALGAPAIAKVSPNGDSVTPWVLEKPNGSQRPGYTGITYDAATDSLIAFGGPRPLTVFKLSDATPTPRPVTINGKFGSLTGTEKIKNIPGLAAINGATRLLGAKAPYIYSFASTDNWSSASFKRYTRNEFKTNGLTSIIEYQVGNMRGAYGTGAYFSEGRNGGRTSTPAFKLDKSLLQ